MKKFMCLYMGSENPTRGPGDLSQDDMAKGMAAWTKWMSDHASAIVDHGGPLSKTLKASKSGVSKTSNHIAGYVIIHAESQEAAAKLFEGHPHFSIFPGEGVEVMEALPIPGS
jgi:uncharacterized protein YbjT (DUF2867 family)